MLFIAINKKDKESAPRTRETFEELKIYPDFRKLLVFSKGSKHTVNSTDGILFYDNETATSIPFVIGEYKLIDCKSKHVYNTARKREFFFSFYDLDQGVIREIKTKEFDPISNSRSFIDALDFVVKEIAEASQFNSWNDYQEYKFVISENKRLKKDIENMIKLTNPNSIL